MRQIILDTETTGLDPKQGHRIIEIAGLELVDRRRTGRHLHFYLNPDREIDVAATEIHGMTWEDLKDKPRFADIAGEFLDFARDAEWVIHNAPFDIAFLDHEFGRAGIDACATCYGALTDTLVLARELFPGKRNSLDALCERFRVDHSQRTLHGALLDAQLLADVYLALTRGQESLTIDIAPPALARIANAGRPSDERPRQPLAVVSPSPEEASAHAAYLEALDRESKGRCVWLALMRAAVA